MLKMMSPRPQIIHTFVIIWAIVILASILSHLLAKSAPASDILAQRPPLNSNQPPPPPPDRGAPGQQSDSGTRGPCENTKIALKPLLPLTDGDYSGFTLKERPTFWFYVPYKTDSVNWGEFVLEDKEGNLVNHLRFKLPKTPGFVSVSIPTTAKPLEKNKLYNWKFLVYCASQPSSKSNYDIKEGLVERVDLAGLETQLETAKLEERIKLYVDNKIWYDASINLANIRDRPQAWLYLLRAVRLEQLKEEAIAGEVVPNEK